MNKTKYASEAWLVSPILDLTSETKATLTFEHAGKNFADVNTMKEQISLWAKTENGDWTELEIQGWPDNASYDYVSGGTFDLASYCGGKMQFAFKYVSTSGSAGTWQVRNVSVTNGAGDSGSEGGDQGGSEGGEDGGDDPVVTPPATGSTVVFDWTTLATTTNTSYTGETIDGIALTGTRIATNKAGQLRIYAPTSTQPAGSLTLNSGDKKMTKIAFTFVSGKEGPLEATGYADGVWTGEANSVTFTNTGAQAQVTKIEITLAE